MAKKENQRIALTRRLLQEGLLRLLESEKLEDISVTALCKEAGINRATFYNHYTSPAALLEEMELSLVSKLQSIITHAETMDDVLNQVEASLILLKDKAQLFRILVRYHVDRDLEIMIRRAAQHYNTYRLNTLQKELDDDTVYLVSSYLYSGCYHLICEWLLHNIDKTPRQIAELLVSVINKEYL